MTEKAEAKALVDACTEFERRGPKLAAVVRLGSSIEVVAQEIHWPEAIASKIKRDNRNDNLADLVSSSRDRLMATLHRIEKSSLRAVGDDLGAGKKSPGPKLG